MRSARVFVEAHEKRHHEIAAELFAGVRRDLMEEARVYSPPTTDVNQVADLLLKSTVAELEKRQDAFDGGSQLKLTCKLQPIPHSAR